MRGLLSGESYDLESYDLERAMRAMIYREL